MSWRSPSLRCQELRQALVHKFPTVVWKWIPDRPRPPCGTIHGCQGFHRPNGHTEIPPTSFFVLSRFLTAALEWQLRFPRAIPPKPQFQPAKHKKIIALSWVSTCVREVSYVGSCRVSLSRSARTSRLRVSACLSLLFLNAFSNFGLFHCVLFAANLSTHTHSYVLHPFSFFFFFVVVVVSFSYLCGWLGLKHQLTN